MMGGESKDPEDVCAAHAASGSSLENSLTRYRTGSGVGITSSFAPLRISPAGSDARKTAQLRLRASDLVSRKRCRRAPLRIAHRIKVRHDSASSFCLGRMV